MSTERKIPTQAEIEQALVVPDIEGKDISIETKMARDVGRTSLMKQLDAASKQDPMAGDVPYFA